MADPCLIAERHPDGILQLTLNRPEALNALNAELLNELEQSFILAEQDKSIKALLLHGVGKAFCAGADIHQLATLKDQEAYLFAKRGQAIFSRLENLGKPSLAAIQGFALGGGCELAMSATLRIATDNARFGQPEVKLGVIPGFGGTQRLARLIGKGRALDLCLSGRLISANEAYAWGLVNSLSEPATLIENALALLQPLTRLPAQALKSVIDVIHQGYNLNMPEALEIEASQFRLCCNTNDKREGVSAFLEKREPQFSGS